MFRSSNYAPYFLLLIMLSQQQSSTHKSTTGKQPLSKNESPTSLNRDAGLQVRYRLDCLTGQNAVAVAYAACLCWLLTYVQHRAKMGQ